MSPAPFERDEARAPERVAAVSAALAGWRRRLTVVGGPNTLLWGAEQPEGTLDLTTAHPGGVSMLLAGRPTRLSDLVRERAAFAEARTGAAAIRGRAVRLHAEHGIRTCFLAAGLATWDHPGASLPPQAPVLLRSCTLRPTDPRASDYDVVLAEEVEVNPVLDQYLRAAAHIEIDTAALAEMSLIGQGLTSGFDPYPVYAALGRLCAGLPGFTVTPRVLVGTYPHGKLAMVSDLAELARPEHAERLAAHPVIAALSTEGADRDGDPVEVVAPAPDVDPDPDPTGERLVLDADAAQGSVVGAVLRGRDVVVHAYPGTGTTQTVANVVAALTGQGSSVLLLAERRAELADVYERLAAVGLGGLLFDAADALVDHRETMRRAAGLLEPETDPHADEHAGGLDFGRRTEVDDRLRAERDTLRDHVAALHEVRVPWGVTMHEAQCAIAELGARTPPPASRVRIRGAALARLSRDRLDELSAQLAGAAERGAWATGGSGDPWYGARIVTSADAQRAQEIVDRLAGGGFEAQAAVLDEILAESSLPAARTVTDWRSALTTMSGVRDTLEVFRPEIFDIPLDEHVAATGSREYRRQQGVELSPWTRSRVRRLATRLLRPGRPPADLHAELVRARTERSAWHALVGAGGRPEISPRLDEAQDAYDRLDADLQWLGERLGPTAAGGDLYGIPLARLRERLAALAARPERLAVLPEVVPVIDELKAAGMGEVVDDFADRGVPAAEVAPELAHLWWVSIAQHVADSDRRYGAHNGTGLREAAHGFARADRDHLRVTAARVRAEADARREAAVRSGQHHATTLRAETTRRGRPSGLRATFDASHDLLLGVAPCWAMSPLLVGEALPPGAWFDVVVVMGAGSTSTAVAVSGMSRGRQVVVVGDPGEGGSRPFTVGAGAPDAAPADASLLDDLAGRLPVHRLGWAHGYEDERLVPAGGDTAEPRLVTVPHPARSAPVALHLVDGRAAVEPGHETTIDSTDGEVDRVVGLVLEHARTHADETLGVVAVTERHAERIRLALAEVVERLDDPSDEAALRFLDAEQRRPVEVVALTAAHGFSRDVVILAVGYGKTTRGRVLHRFPALSAPEGPACLAAALGAARRRLVVVSSIAPDDLDPERLRDGGLLLRLLLQRAATSAAGADAGSGEGGVGEGSDGDEHHVDPLITDLGARLRREGMTVAERYGTGPHTVDLAVTDHRTPDRWLVAVEGDGPAYAAWPGTRERDRLWPQELERRGWTHLRVWSTDLYRDPAREVARVVGVVRDAARALGETDPAAADDLAEPETSVQARESEAAVEPQVAVSAGSEPSEPDPADATDAPDATAPELEVNGAEAPKADVPGAPQAETQEGATPEPETPLARRRGFRRARSGPTTPSSASSPTPAGPGPAAPVIDPTADDTDAGWGERRSDATHERWLQEQRPPHWD